MCILTGFVFLADTVVSVKKCKEGWLNFLCIYIEIQKTKQKWIYKSLIFIPIPIRILILLWNKTKCMRILLTFLPPKNSRLHMWVDAQLALKFIYSEKATKFCKIFTLYLTVCIVVKFKVEILQNFVAFSEYMNFNFLLIFKQTVFEFTAKTFLWAI